MKKVNALKVRTKFGAVLEELDRNKEPILLTKGQEVKAAIVPIQLFKQRFVDLLAQDALTELLHELKELRKPPKGNLNTLKDLRTLRGNLL